MRIERAEDSWVAAVAISVLTLVIVTIVLSVPSMLRDYVSGIVSCCCGNRRSGGVPPPPPPAPPAPAAALPAPTQRLALTNEAKNRARETRRTNDTTKKRNAEIAVWAETFVHYLATLPPNTTIGTMLQSYRTPLMEYFPRLTNGPPAAHANGLALLGAAAAQSESEPQVEADSE